MLCGDLAVLQAPMFDGHAFDAGALASEGVGKPGFGSVRPCRCCPGKGQQPFIIGWQGGLCCSRVTAMYPKLAKHLAQNARRIWCSVGLRIVPIHFA